MTEKYRTLYAALNDEWIKYGLALKEELQRQRDSVQTERDQSVKVRDQRKKAIEDAYGQWLSASDERLGTLQGSHNLADKRLSELQYWHPMEKEIAGCREDIQMLNAQKQELDSQLTVTANSLKALRQERELKNDQIKDDYERRQKETQGQLGLLQDELAETDALLARWKGSLYDWLTQHKPGWEQTIGKVVDEQQVLYAQGLSPQLTEVGDHKSPQTESLFGVSLNLEAIPVHHRTPDDYRNLQKQQQETVAAKKKELSELPQQCEKEQEELRKRYRGKITELSEAETLLRVQIEQIPTKVKDAETRLRQAVQKEKELIEAEREKRTKVNNETLLALQNEKTARTKQRDKRDKELKAADSDYNAALRGLQKQFDAFRQKQADDKANRQKDIDERRKMLEREERDELKGKGADTNAIDLCKGYRPVASDPWHNSRQQEGSPQLSARRGRTFLARTGVP